QNIIAGQKTTEQVLGDLDLALEQYRANNGSTIPLERPVPPPRGALASKGPSMPPSLRPHRRHGARPDGPDPCPPSPGAPGARRTRPASASSCGGDGGDTQKAYEQVIAAFEAENPGITVNAEFVNTNDYDSVLKTRLSGGAGPDVYGFDPKNLADFVRDGF
ncbi:hypothetical protein HR12_24390, partial [Microbacterium sp. SUBG005]